MQHRGFDPPQSFRWKGFSLSPLFPLQGIVCCERGGGGGGGGLGGSGRRKCERVKEMLKTVCSSKALFVFHLAWPSRAEDAMPRHQNMQAEISLALCRNITCSLQKHHLLSAETSLALCRNITCFLQKHHLLSEETLLAPCRNITC